MKRLPAEGKRCEAEVIDIDHPVEGWKPCRRPGNYEDENGHRFCKEHALQ